MIKKNISLANKIGAGYNEFVHSRNFFRVVKGSRGSKKSKTTALDYIYKLLKYPWANLLVVRRYSNTNKQSTYTDMKWAIARFGLSHLFKFNESMPEITIKQTGQKILFRGLDDELKITSITAETGILCWLWVEEAYQIENQSKFDTLVESIRGSHESKQFYKQVTVTFNPWNENHWLKSAFFDEGTRFNDVFARTTTFRLNEFLDESDKSRYLDLYRTNPRRARVVCEGEWGVAEGLIFEDYKVENFDKQAILDSVDLICHGMDYGFKNDPTTFVTSALDLENGKLYIVDELWEKGMTTERIYNAVCSKKHRNSLIVGDSSEPRLLAELRTKGLTRLNPSRKGKDSVMQGINYMQSFDIIIHENCKKTIEEFSSYSYEQDKEGNWLNKPQDKNNHIIDAIRYSIEQYSLKNKQQYTKENYQRIKRLF